MNKKKKNTAPAAHQPADMPSLRTFWEELQRSCGTVCFTGSFGSARIGSRGSGRGSGGSRGSGSRGSGSRGSGSRGSGSRGSRGSRHGSFRGGDDDALGYGLSLIVPDFSDEERVQMILRRLCEKDAAVRREKKDGKE